MREITKSGPLLDGQGNLVDYGWARQPLLDANLEITWQSFFETLTISVWGLSRST